ncbi:uncharacterized protein [Typha angustifolia]|uniref:uncharacterized protein isoform X2 n=1 Tax=Typha angustifolia TaxID=59011 RepID=UPI003C2EEDCF
MPPRSVTRKLPTRSSANPVNSPQSEPTKDASSAQDLITHSSMEKIAPRIDAEEDPEEELVEEYEEEEEEVTEEVERKEVAEPSNQRRRQRDFEVFAGGLPRDATEEDLERVFEKVGDVVEVRLARIPHSDKNKGFAFVRFATVEQARNATDLKYIQVRGKSCGVTRSIGNETLHLGNICTTWTKDDLVEKLKAFNLENLEEVHLIEDPNRRGKNRGYAFLDFSTHMDAVAACSKLQKRNVYFGTDVRAEVSFSKTVEPDEEVMAQVKSIFLDGLPTSWDEAHVRNQLEKFGEIENVQLARNMPSAKRKDFGFIIFKTRQAALDCIDMVNKDGIGEGAEKVLLKATLKKPLQKRTRSVLGIRRGYIGKSYGENMHPYSFSRSTPGRHSRSHELSARGYNDNDKSRSISRFPPRAVEELSPPAGKYGDYYRRDYTREVTVSSSRYRDEYLESSYSNRHSGSGYRDIPYAYSRSREPYSDAHMYELHYEHHDDYEYAAVSGYKRSYSGYDHDLPSSSQTRLGRSRPDLQMASYPRDSSSGYDEYSRRLPNERPSYGRTGYTSREYEDRYLPADRAYY